MPYFGASFSARVMYESASSKLLSSIACRALANSESASLAAEAASPVLAALAITCNMTDCEAPCAFGRCGLTKSAKLASVNLAVVFKPVLLARPR